jgi:hypothetical protein
LSETFRLSIVEDENGVLREIFGPKRDEPTSLKKLYNQEFYSV